MQWQNTKTEMNWGFFQNRRKNLSQGKKLESGKIPKRWKKMEKKEKKWKKRKKMEKNGKKMEKNGEKGIEKNKSTFQNT